MARGGNQTGEVSHGSREELLWDARNGREMQASGGGQQEGAPSRWKVALQPCDRGGGEKLLQKNREKMRHRVKDGGR